jgi:hypothetical protein
MKKITKEKLELWLFVFVAVTTLGALAASMTHMIEAFGWANLPWMSWTLAVVIVAQNGAFVALASISRDKIIRRAVFAGIVLLFLVEFWGNYWAGGLMATHLLPRDLDRLFFNLDRDIIIGTGTFLFAAFLPLLNLISIFALSEAAKRLVESTGQPQPINQWAEMVLQMREKGPTGGSHSQTEE